MRYLKTFSLSILLSLTLFSCSESGPEATAEKFITLTNQGEFAEAKKLCTENTAQLLIMAESMLQDDKKNKIKEKNKDLDIEITSTIIDGDKARVKYKIIDAGVDKEQQLDLVKVKGEWKVNIFMGGA